MQTMKETLRQIHSVACTASRASVQAAALLRPLVTPGAGQGRCRAF